MSNSNTPLTAVDDAFVTDEDTLLTGDLFADNGNGADIGADLSVLTVNGSDAVVGQDITLASGALLTVNADGTFDYDPNGQFDSLTVGDSATDTFTYQITDDSMIQPPGTFAATFELSSLLAENGGDGSTGFVLNGIDADDQSGFSVSSAGDVNGDGVDDLIIGSIGADPNGSSSGETYVVFGRQGGGFGASLELSSLAAGDGSTGFVLGGIDADDVSGRSVSSAGDVNGDGVDDMIIGAPDVDPYGNSFADESYVVFGRANFATVTVTVNGVNDAPVALDDEYIIDGDDVVELLPSVLENDFDPEFSDTLRIQEIDNTGTLGDVALLNDTIINFDPTGAFGDLARGEVASDAFSYTLVDDFGLTSTATVNIQIMGTSRLFDDLIVGTNADDFVEGGVGFDTIVGGYGDDQLYGENGDDLMNGGGRRRHSRRRSE